MATQPLLYTLHIQLEPLQLDPPIWRRIRVSGDCTPRKLHHFIQAAMGWHSSHLHEFSLGMNRYMPLDAEFMDDDEALDDRKFKLRRMLKEGDRLRYLYDFGDSWQHVIAVETVEPCDFTGTWCEVLDGARACPPEGCRRCAGLSGLSGTDPATGQRGRPKRTGMGRRLFRP